MNEPGRRSGFKSVTLGVEGEEEGKMPFVRAERADRDYQSKGLHNGYCWYSVAMAIEFLNVNVAFHSTKANFFSKQVLMRRSQNSHRKRPHVLPPMSNSQTLLRPIDPLMPPDLLLMENRLGSPAPKPTPRDCDYEFNANDGRPTIKVSDPEDTPRRESSSRESMRLDLLSDPLFSNDSDLLMKIQKRNVFRGPEGGDKRHDRENCILNNFCRNQLKNLRNDLDKKLRCSSIRPLEENMKVKCPDVKIVQIPNRYAPLKPIGQNKNENKN